jgi:thiamine phosphate phosphatase / amino-HMP aminohydrolase
MSTRPELWIFADWDETITSHDTLSLIAPPDSSDPNGPPPFSYFSQYYTNLVREHEREFGPRDTLDRQLEYLASLAPVEQASMKKVEERGLFKGVREEDIRKRAQYVEFRDGWKEFTERAMNEQHVQLKGVLSVNWSKVFIRSALQRIHDDEFMRQFEIRANVCNPM